MIRVVIVVTCKAVSILQLLQDFRGIRLTKFEVKAVLFPIQDLNQDKGK